MDAASDEDALTGVAKECHQRYGSRLHLLLNVNYLTGLMPATSPSGIRLCLANMFDRLANHPYHTRPLPDQVGGNPPVARMAVVGRMALRFLLAGLWLAKSESEHKRFVAVVCQVDR